MRISCVQMLRVDSISLSSILLVGDALRVKSNSKDLIIQSKAPFYLGPDRDFSEFPIFAKEIPETKAPVHIQMNVRNESKCIKVREIDVNSAADSSVIQIGSTCSLACESRIKNIKES
ncbi:spore germination protein GerPE [Paenibacillus thiaminolyticus]|uniref:Spore germination protein GerPE n=1 Tax=Paenibacillus thiaminolyticus TaxID=49283 RepID=A0AAP9DRR3_PANTH|nr:spore germination protein GerPE [Paenibacillus thiaminolyticus]